MIPNCFFNKISLSLVIIIILTGLCPAGVSSARQSNDQYPNLESLPSQGTTPSQVIQVTNEEGKIINPSILQTNDGTLWLAWESQGIHYKTSTDGGLTWSDTRRIPYRGGQQDPSLVETDDNRVCFVWQSNRSLFLSITDDRGLSWSKPYEIVDSSNTEDRNLEPDIAWADDGTVCLVWNSFRTGKYEIWYKTSSDNGKTWTEDIQLTFEISGAFRPSVLCKENGTIMIAWQSLQAENYGISFVTSGDKGKTWSDATQITNNKSYAGNPSIMQMDDGTICIAYDAHIGYRNIYYITSNDNGLTWSEQKQFTRFSGLDQFPDISASGDNGFIIVWVSERSSSYTNIWLGKPGSLEDIDPPPIIVAVKQLPFPNADANDPISIMALFIDETGITSVTCHWYINGVKQPDLVMYNDGTHGDIISNDRYWSMQIGPFSAGSQIEYRIQAIDTGGNAVTTAVRSFQIFPLWVPENKALFIPNILPSHYVEECIMAFDSLGLSIDIWDESIKRVPDSEAVSHYTDGFIIWDRPVISGSHYSPPYEENSDEAIVSYLLNGGKTILTGEHSTLDSLILLLNNPEGTDPLIPQVEPIETYGEEKPYATRWRIDTGIYKFEFFPFSIAAAVSKEITGPLIQNSIDWLFNGDYAPEVKNALILADNNEADQKQRVQVSEQEQQIIDLILKSDLKTPVSIPRWDYKHLLEMAFMYLRLSGSATN